MKLEIKKLEFLNDPKYFQIWRLKFTMNKAIFLDRDGVINKEIGSYVFKADDFVFNNGIFEAAAKWQANGFMLIVITNQGGIAKGLYSYNEVNNLHDMMEKEFAKNGINLTEIYYCPHHHLVSKCICRKPGSQMLEKAIARFNIDKQKSYFVGDNERDISAAVGAGVIPIKIEANQNLLSLHI